MKPYIVGIAGGSGAGKSTLAFGLRDALPGAVTVIHLDDYFRKQRAPLVEGMVNWDHPDTVDSDLLIHDLRELKAGRSVTILTKNQTNEGTLNEMDERRPVRHDPSPLIVVEGFLSLHYPGLREVYDRSFFLDLPFDAHIARRVHFINDAYSTKVLRPMHDQYVAPTKALADHVIEVSDKSVEQVLSEVESLLPDSIRSSPGS